MKAMPIQGLTNKEARKSYAHDTLGGVGIEIAKGDRKPERGIGKDLQFKYRITTSHPLVLPILKKYYGTPNQNGDFIIDQIRFYFPYQDSDRNCPTKMVAFKKSHFLLECDRQHITKRTFTDEGTRDGVLREIRNVKEPCPMAGKHLAAKCPNGCTKSAQLYIYIKEIFDAGFMIPAVIEFHGFEDMDVENGVLAQMDKWARTFGSITESPFAMQIRHSMRPELTLTSKRIPFILTRAEVSQKKPVIVDNKRTGNNTVGKTWRIDITPDPNWLTELSIWQQKQDEAEEIKRAGYRLKPKAIAGLLHSSIPFNPSDATLEAEVVEAQPQLEPAREEEAMIEPEPQPETEAKPWIKPVLEATLSADQGEVIKGLLKESVWNFRPFILMLVVDFGIQQRLGEVKAKDYNEVCARISNSTLAQDWLEQLSNLQPEYGWTNDGWLTMLEAQFGVKRMEDVKGEEFARFCAIAANPEQAKHWNKMANDF